tara:strand:+ start:262 stop:576 length:315 start_codon:yes stop_codon:yes gene_type:complete
MSRYYDRYRSFKENGKGTTLPFINLPIKGSDQRVLTDKKTRFDKLSQRFYGNPYHGWLILLANPEFGGLEFDIPESSVIIVPFPLEKTLEDYQQQVDSYKRLYG